VYWKPGFIFCLIAGLAACLAPTARAAEGYLVAVGDKLMLDFLDDEVVPYELTVGYRGDVQLPFLGSVEIADLPLREARERIVALYVENQIFLAPRLELSIVNYRPVSVLGDVRTPGLVDFMPFMTVEQAVGMAGGALTPANSEEGRTLRRAALRGELRQLEIELTRETAAAERVRAQLAGENIVDAGTVPEPAGINADLFADLRRREQEMMQAEAEDHAAQIKFLDESIAEAETELKLGLAQIELQEEQIASYGEELDRRALQTTPARTRLERQAADEDGTLLRLNAYLAQTRRELSGLKRERLAIEFVRRQAWRRELSEREVRIDQLLANRESLTGQLNLLADWTQRLADSPSEIALEYRIRHRGKNGFETRVAEQTDEVLPGDVVLVRVAAPELLASPALPPEARSFE
jgi:protein involved in polysaccharide export with SLBB domain